MANIDKNKIGRYKMIRLYITLEFCRVLNNVIPSDISTIYGPFHSGHMLATMHSYSYWLHYLCLANTPDFSVKWTLLILIKETQ